MTAGPPGFAVRLRRAALHRLGSFALTVLLAVCGAAALIRLAPGFGIDERAFDPRLSAESIRALEARQRGGDGFLPWLGTYAAGLVRGDLGQSTSLSRPVRDLFAERAAITARNTAAGLAFAWAAALAASLLLVAWRRRGWNFAATAAASLLLCLPSAALALLALYAGAGAGLAVGVILAPRLFRYARNALAAAERSPHVLAARARGVAGASLMLRHVCLPASPELVALVGVSVNMALGAAIPVEALCDSPGLGQLVWLAATARDLPVLVNMTVLVAASTAGANLLADAARAAVPQGGA